MQEKDYMEIRKDLVTGQQRKRSRAYPLLIGLFGLMILVNVVMLAMNNF